MPYFPYPLMSYAEHVMLWLHFYVNNFVSEMSEIETLHVKEVLQYAYEIVFSTNCDIISVFL